MKHSILGNNQNPNIKHTSEADVSVGASPLNQLTQALILAPTLSDLCLELSLWLPRLVCTQLTLVLVLDSTTDEFEVVFADGAIERHSHGMRFPANRGDFEKHLPSEAIHTSLPDTLVQSQPSLDPNVQESTTVGVPIIVQEQLLGRLYVSTDVGAGDCNDDVALLRHVASIFAASLHKLQQAPHDTNATNDDSAELNASHRRPHNTITGHWNTSGSPLSPAALAQARSRSVVQALKKVSSVVENSPVVLMRWRAEPHMPVEYVSENIRRYGFSADAFMRGEMSLSQIIHPEDYAYLDGELRKHIQKGVRDFVQKFRFVTADGELCWIENRIYVEYDENRRAVCFQAVAIDITERQRTEEKLLITRLSVEYATDLVFWILPDGCIEYANQAACSILGYSKDEFQSISIFDLDPAFHTLETSDYQSHPNFGRWIEPNANNTTLFEAQQRTKSGTIIPVEVHCNRQVVDEQSYIFAFVRDITERKAVEAELQEQNELRHMIEFSINSAPQAIFWLTHDGYVLNANDGASRMLGYSRDEFLAMNIKNVDPNYRPAGPEVWSRFRTQGIIILESLLYTKDGKTVPAEVHLSYLKYHEQEYQFAFVQDISQRKKAEAARLAVENQLRRRLQEEELLRQVLSLTARSGDLTDTMGQICQLMADFYDIPRSGYVLFDEKQSVGTVIAEFIRDDQPSSVGMEIPIAGNPSIEYILSERTALVIRNAQESSKMAPINELMRELGVVSVIIAPIFIEGVIVGTIGFDAGQIWDFSDADVALAENVSSQIGQALHRVRIMDELVKTSKALQKSEVQLKEALGRLLSPICIVTVEGQYVYANDAFAYMLGTDSESLLAQATAHELYVDAAERQMLLDEIQAEGQVVDYKVHFRKVDGTEFWASVSVYSMDFDGESVLLSSVYDLSEQMRSEQILRDAKEAAEEANRTKSLFLSNMTHELRTPMNGVLGMTSLLLDTELSDDQTDIVNTIRSSGDTLLTVINDVLDFSKIEANKLELEPVAFHLGSAIDDTTQLILPLMKAKGLNFVFELDEDVPEWIVQDATRLRQIMTNLLSNSVKFTAAGEIKLRIEMYNPDLLIADKPRLSPLATDGKLDLHFSVSDTGIGIPSERLHRLFKPFSQVDASTTRRYGGTGLGLAISKQICELMGGRMWVDSEIDIGTTFHFTIRTEATLPLTPPTSVLAHNARPIVGNPNNLDSNRAVERGQIRSILLVEDNVVNQKVAIGILKKIGYSADIAGNGLEALDALHRQAYDIVLMDIQMPEMDGVTATQRIREHWPPDQQPVIIALTANAMEQQRQEYLSAGMDDYVTKPIRIPELTEALDRALTKIMMSA